MTKRADSELRSNTDLLLSPHGSSHNLRSPAATMLSFARMDFTLQLLIKINPVWAASVRHFAMAIWLVARKHFSKWFVTFIISLDSFLFLTVWNYITVPYQLLFKRPPPLEFKNCPIGCKGILGLSGLMCKYSLSLFYNIQSNACPACADTVWRDKIYFLALPRHHKP